jgi:hypothetical protein
MADPANELLFSFRGLRVQTSAFEPGSPAAARERMAQLACLPAYASDSPDGSLQAAEALERMLQARTPGRHA